MLSELFALEEIQIAPRRKDEVRLKEVDVGSLVAKGYVKEENGFLYLTELGVKRLSELYGMLDVLQRIYIDLSYGREVKVSEFNEEELKKLKGLIEVKDGYVYLTFEGIKIVAQRIAEKMVRGH